jgi:hypothetical protein
MNDLKTYFTTYDLNLSAVLLSKGFSLEKIDKQQSGKALFSFVESKKLYIVIDQYWKDQLKISPQKIFNSLKAIKNRLYSNWE